MIILPSKPKESMVDRILSLRTDMMTSAPHSEPGLLLLNKTEYHDLRIELRTRAVGQITSPPDFPKQIFGMAIYVEVE